MVTTDRNQIYLREIASLHNRYVPDDVQLVERNGYIFFCHPTRSYDPVTLMVLMAVGGGIGIAQTLQQGKESEKISKARAQIDIDNAKAVRRRSVEEAEIGAEKRQRARATAKSAAAAGNIRINEGAPLVIDTQILADATKDIGFRLERGRVESADLRFSAALEIAAGKAAKKKSRFDALKMGLGLAVGLGGMGANLPGGGTTPGDTTFSGLNTSPGFGTPTHTGARFA